MKDKRPDPLEARTHPLTSDRPGPAVWLVGAHGGAGVSTLAHFLAFTGDSRRQWPCGTDREAESPYVVIVARETISGLAEAHGRILELNDRPELGIELLGLVTVADSQKLTKAVRQYREVVAASVPEHWSIGWHSFLPSAELRALPSWHPLEGVPTQTKGAAVPSDVIEAGIGIVTAVQRALPGLRAAR
ncbi:DUF6668 family protein [Rhodococcus sp. NPDC058481]|uniref:DUF6668 family protein n=1 Tax=unclassified Rhodococcus (in: high G+C Gram-positive bacteria) TaxID=192944 RepID=UPI00364CECBC